MITFKQYLNEAKLKGTPEQRELVAKWKKISQDISNEIAKATGSHASCHFHYQTNGTVVPFFGGVEVSTPVLTKPKKGEVLTAEMVRKFQKMRLMKGAKAANEIVKKHVPGLEIRMWDYDKHYEWPAKRNGKNVKIYHLSFVTNDKQLAKEINEVGDAQRAMKPTGYLLTNTEANP